MELAVSLQNATNQYGAAFVMKQLQDYILDFDRPIDDQTFLDELLAGDGKNVD